MVSRLIDSQHDAVSKRLASGDGKADRSILQWLEGQQLRTAMRRRATWCAMGGWLLMAVASIVSSLIALVMSREAMVMFSETFNSPVEPPSTLVAIPVVLAVVAGLITLGGLSAWWGGFFPGWSRIISAIGWSSGSDAVARLLDAGCTYPEAFRLAAEVSACRSTRSWLRLAAERVEQGGPSVMQGWNRGGDAEMLEALVEKSDPDPGRHWNIAASHFTEVASRRLSLFLQSMPAISVLVSGLLLWIAVTATVGWMWRAVAEMMSGLS